MLPAAEPVRNTGEQMKVSNEELAGMVAEYNDIARKVCAEMKIPVNDLYAVALPLRDDQADGCHFSAEGYGILADAVAKRILAVLGR